MFNLKHPIKVLTLLGCLAFPGAALAVPGDLSFGGCAADTDAAAGCVDLTGTPLQTAYSTAVSPDGRSVYVVGRKGKAVAHFFRGPGGELAYDGCVNDDGSSNCADVPASALDGASDVDVSADGRSVYVASSVSHAVVHFKRAPEGQITFDGCWAPPNPADGCTDVADTRLLGAQGVKVSPDGGSVYVAAADSSALSRFSRDTATGQLTVAGCWRNPDPQDACIDIPGGSFDQPRTIAISTDGKSLYLTSPSSDSVAHFFRDPEKGVLAYDGCVANTGTHGCADLTGSPLSSAIDVAVSPDDESVYVTASGNNSVAHFFRDKPGGQLLYDGCVGSNSATGCTDAPGLPFLAPAGVAVSPDGRSVYVSSSSNAAIAHLRRQQPDGQIVFASCLGANDLGCGTVAGNPFAASLSLAVSPDGRSVYATGHDAASISRFDREPEPVVTPDPTPDPTPEPTVTPEPVTPQQSCGGRTATLVGTTGADRLRGTAGTDVIAALGGADRVTGLRGGDVVCGGAGRDVLRGGPGRDRCIGGAGRDRAASCETRRSL